MHPFFPSSFLSNPLAARAKPLLAAIAIAALALGGALVSTGPANAQDPSTFPTPGKTLVAGSLRTNGLSNPLGIPGVAPVFSWKNSSTGRSVRQTDYEIRVAPTPAALADAPTWSSGRVTSDDQLNVVYGGTALAAQSRYYWQVRTWSNHGTTSDWSEAAWFETALQSAAEWNADWIGAPEGEPAASAPLLRSQFSVAKSVSSARVYAAARGVYELSINGTKVGDQQLAPGFTDYRKRIQYQTYDVTSLVQNGQNAIGAMIGDGWYAGNIASFGPEHWGSAPSLIAQLRLDYSDGSHDVVKTDSSWLTAPGPIVESDIIMGESYDAGLLPAGWNTASAATEGWTPVAVVDPADSAVTALLQPQTDQPVRVTAKRIPVSRAQSAPGTWIYDMGQNMFGVASMDRTGASGSTASIRYGEMLNPDKTLYTANLRSAKATDHFTFATTGTSNYTPLFTYHGYRYLEITGVTTPPTIAQVIGLVWGSDLPTVGTLDTSDAMLNQLQSNITWGQRGNFLSVPTDTPARDERLGWAGDINVFSPTASYNQDTQAFLSKWLVDLADSQYSDGDLPGVAPSSPGVTIKEGTGWSDAAITVPYMLYNSYGNTGVVRQSYEMMARFMAFLETSAGASLIRTSGDYADWLNLDDPTSAELLGTAYYAHDARLMSTMAASIGETTDAAHYADLAERVTAAFASRFIADDGTVEGNSQTGYAMAIGMGLVPSKTLPSVGEKYLQTIADHDYHLSTGFLGTPWLLPALTAIGQQDVAYRLLTTDTFPSWGYEVASGATTMWERWDSLKPDGSFGAVEMNSFNHYAYGAVGDWMYRNIGGITPTSAGYRTFDIAPSPGGGLTRATGTLDSGYGTIVSDWTTAGAGFTLDATVPVGTTATVKLPGEESSAITEGGDSLDRVDGITVVSATDGTVVLTVGSGHYVFSSDPANAAANDAAANDDTASDDTASVGATILGAFGPDVTAPTVWGWLDPDGRVAALAQDGGSGVAHLEYSLDSTTWQSGLSSLPATDSAPTSLHVRAVDAAGNPSEPIELDQRDTAPELMIVADQSTLVEADGFDAGAVVGVELHSDPLLLGTATADTAGKISVLGSVPASFPAGLHTLAFVVDADGAGTPSGVDRSADGLARTGSDPTRWILGGVILLLLGGVFTGLRFVGRGRRRQASR
ncbi:hypothetical protein BH09ACT1_BH09ACT1_26510 [soil metagenome]